MAKEPEKNSEVAEDADAQPETPAVKAAPAPRAGMFLVIVFGFVMMVSTPLITYFVVRATVNNPVEAEAPKEKKKNDKAPQPPRPTPETVVDVEPVVVNIDGTQGTRYLKLAVQLVASEPKLAEELRDTSRRALVKDRIIASAGNKTITDLEGERGRESLRREIIQRLNGEFAGKMSGVVIDVYYSEYLIQ